MTDNVWNNIKQQAVNTYDNVASFCTKQAQKVEHNFNNRTDTGKALLVGSAFVGIILNPIGFPIAFAASYAISDQFGDIVDRIKDEWNKQPFGVKAAIVLTSCIVLLCAPNIIAGILMGALVGMELGQGQPGSSNASDMLLQWKDKLMALFQRSDSQQNPSPDPTTLGLTV